MQIARKLGYATDKPVRKAIDRGELRAIYAPCRRRLIVAESELVRWLEQLAYEPGAMNVASPPADPTPPNGHGRRRHVPTLDYDAMSAARR